MRDSMIDDVAARLGLPPAVRSANGAVPGPAIDTAGNRNNFRVGMLVAVAGVITDGTHTISIEDSDTGSGGWAPIPDAGREGANPVLTSAQSGTVARLGFSGTRRYVRAVITTSGAPGTPVGGIISAVVLLTAGSGRPVT